jgi:hypothetical protein
VSSVTDGWYGEPSVLIVDDVAFVTEVP